MKEFLAVVAALLTYDLIRVGVRHLSWWWAGVKLRSLKPTNDPGIYAARPVSRVSPPDQPW